MHQYLKANLVTTKNSETIQILTVPWKSWTTWQIETELWVSNTMCTN